MSDVVHVGLALLELYVDLWLMYAFSRSCTGLKSDRAGRCSDLFLYFLGKDSLTHVLDCLVVLASLTLISSNNWQVNQILVLGYVSPLCYIALIFCSLLKFVS